MLHLCATCLLLLAVKPASPQATIRVGLFGLFQPQQLNVRLAAGEAFSLRAGSLNEARIKAGEIVRLRKTGRQMQISIIDVYGRLRQTTMAQEARLTPLEASALELDLPKKMLRVVRGELLVTAEASASRNALQIVLRADREQSVASVVAAEMSGIDSFEALKALAVVVRTFMIAQANRHAKEGYDFCDTTHCQVYRGEADLQARSASQLVERAVGATGGEILRFDKRPIEGYYTAVCGGVTAAPEMVWGGATHSAYPYKPVICKWCAQSRYSRWERKADAASVLDALSAWLGFRLSQGAEISIEKYKASEVVQTVLVKDRGRRRVMSGDEFRRAIGRRIGWNRVLAPTFTLEHHADSFIFRGRGFGSQVGLCVAGAAAQAAAGRSYKEILGFYYPQTEIDLD
jgi:stage II sporulation protein D